MKLNILITGDNRFKWANLHREDLAHTIFPEMTDLEILKIINAVSRNYIILEKVVRYKLVFPAKRRTYKFIDTGVIFYVWLPDFAEYRSNTVLVPKFPVTFEYLDKTPFEGA